MCDKINSYSIIGCGGHARSVADVILSNDNETKIIFYDVNAREGECIFENQYKVNKLQENMQFEYRNVLIAIGDNKERSCWIDKVKQMGDYTFPPIISNLSYIGKHSCIEEGAFIAHGVHIGPEVNIGAFSIINTNAVIEHEVKIGRCCHISVNSTVCGRCYLGDNVFIGAGAVIRDKIEICSNVTIGAGSVVISNIVNPGTYVGCPARKI